MYKVHGFLDSVQILNKLLPHLPRLGDTMRFAGERYGIVTEVIWCMDEDDQGYPDTWQRINLRIETDNNGSV